MTLGPEMLIWVRNCLFSFLPWGEEIVMERPASIPAYRTLDEFLEGASPTSLQRDVVADVSKERENCLLDHDLLRRQQDWGSLIHQMVGAEHE